MKRSSRDTWVKRVFAWQRSGKSGAEYAEQIGVNRSALYYWKSRLAKEESKTEPTAKHNFIEVLPSSLAVGAGGPFEVQVGDYRITVPADFDAAALRKLLRIVTAVK